MMSIVEYFEKHDNDIELFKIFQKMSIYELLRKIELHYIIEENSNQKILGKEPRSSYENFIIAHSLNYFVKSDVNKWYYINEEFITTSPTLYELRIYISEKPIFFISRYSFHN